MKRNVFIFGLISGLIVSAFMAFTAMACYNNPEFEGNMVAGFASMIIAFSFIFVGIKNFRDRYNGGVVSFGKAFMIGLYISLIGSSLYVLTWLIMYYNFIPDFMERYSAHVMKEAQKSGDQVVIAQKAKDMANYKEWYKSPIMVILLTYMEVLPIGLIVTIISALILKRKTNPTSGAAAN